MTITICNAQVVQEERTGWIVEDMPLFDNKDPAISFRKYIQSQVNIYSHLVPDSISGRVIVQFFIDTTGSVVEAQVVRSLEPHLDSLASAIIAGSPKWSPALNRGHKVKIAMTFPILFNMPLPIYDELVPVKEKNRKRKKQRSK